eukprot:TRINITY_DN39607_c0_g2_i1.p1 TRINITY_DN39607_c0_g2~~TRINITY_DN39607_c0_g2_i1.p1  ORF type:complete len:259 (+),score=26.25 TRINITY_DN39607_c0_g2_i1:2-778(+)
MEAIGTVDTSTNLARSYQGPASKWSLWICRHGYSDGPGGMCYYERMDDIVNDLSHIVDTIKGQHPDIPLVLFAESWSALVGAQVGIRKNPNLAGLILGGGLFKLLATKISPVEMLVYRLLSRFFPKFTISNKGLDETFDSAFGLPEWAAAARADPLVPGSGGMKHNLITIRPAAETLLAMPRVRKAACDIEAPLLVIHGETDTRCCVTAAKEIFEKAASKDKELIIYPDASHQLFMDGDTNVARVIGDILAWLRKRFA